ncbi:tyrosine-type recombinase/integrase [Rathayibacter sp. VKM Ac-2803]|uniref:tyrosine-type recombinase/integrase n=1 Tax=Rathayibacter sp. VKM Ac-2803 TaxID=2609256 RepID=UPI001357671E|nr:tyrosine-type recombinase/integrase [Rathayibacter sp. VKM Ac-2803]MWV50046.1 tyrosine-type recombinase/integrase [Rathayibacter sp. VKM Ac-2803]
MLSTPDLLDLWSAEMRAQHCRERTIRERLYLMRALERFCERALLELTRHDLIRFLGRRDLSGRTKQNYRSHIHTFYTWMQDEQLRLDNPAARLPRPRVEKREPNPVTREQLQRVLDSGIYGATRMKILLYAFNGLRASEIAAIAGDAIDWEERRVFTREGKGRKEVWRPLHPLVWEEAQKYPRAGWWFPSPIIEGVHVGGKSVSATLSAAFKRAGIEHTGHHLRAFFITELLEAGVHPDVAQHLARHSTGETLREYARPSDRRSREALELLPSVVVPITAARGRYRAGGLAEAA